MLFSVAEDSQLKTEAVSVEVESGGWSVLTLRSPLSALCSPLPVRRSPFPVRRSPFPVPRPPSPVPHPYA